MESKALAARVFLESKALALGVFSLAVGKDNRGINPLRLRCGLQNKIKRSKNSLYISILTTALKMAMRNQTRIEDVFMQVSAQVEEKSRGRQIPIYKSSLKKTFCFGGV